MGTTVYTVQIALPSAEAMKQFYSLMHAAEAAEDRWSRETGTEMLERMFKGDLNDDECSFFSACWNILINTGDFARLLCAYTTMEATFQDPGVDHVAFKPSLVQQIQDAELLPVVIEAYQDALTALEDKDKTLALVREQRDNELRTNTELERANSAQDDHINQQQDRIDTLERKNDELGKYAGKLEQPIKLPNTTTNRHEWTTWQWIEHVGGRYQHGCPMDYIEFGSVMAVGAMLKQFQRTVIAVALVEIKNSLRLQGFKVEEE